MKTIILLFMISMITEALVDYFEFLFDFIEDDSIRKVVKQMVALAISIVFAFQFSAGLIAVATAEFGATVNPIFDSVITGIFCSRGANYLANIIRLIISAGTKMKNDVDDFWSMFDFEEDEEDESVDEDAEE